ncbi:GINS complex, Psf1 component [Auriculariales sp. MPI-PUGE-AT-0066]|nr:GINS complex, Psf1 component [Auriculariales sp. MPI-PUGE-AT-0066]
MALIVEARRTAAQPVDSLNPGVVLPKYNETVVQNVCREMRMLDTDMNATIQPWLNVHGGRAENEVPDDGVQAAMMMYHVAKVRNKRILLAYVQSRLDRLRDLYWASGGALHHLLGNATLRERISPHEVDFLRKYHEQVVVARAEYEFGDILDLTSGIDKPPKDLIVTIRALTDLGDVHTDDGTINLRRGERLDITRSAVEHLIVQGFLEEVPK